MARFNQLNKKQDAMHKALQIQTCFTALERFWNAKLFKLTSMSLDKPQKSFILKLVTKNRRHKFVVYEVSSGNIREFKTWLAASEYLETILEPEYTQSTLNIS